MNFKAKNAHTLLFYRLSSSWIIEIQMTRCLLQVVIFFKTKWMIRCLGAWVGHGIWHDCYFFYLMYSQPLSFFKKGIFLLFDIKKLLLLPNFYLKKNRLSFLFYTLVFFFFNWYKRTSTHLVIVRLNKKWFKRIFFSNLVECITRLRI